MQIVSWNVNGLRACAKKGFLDFLNLKGPFFLGLQEVRAEEHQLPPELLSVEKYHYHLVPAERKGYSGVGCYSKIQPKILDASLGEERFDKEGRLQICQLGKLIIANVYFPNGNGKDRDNSRIPYKLDFYAALFKKLKPYQDRKIPILVLGDYNTAHHPIDLARPEANKNTSGFCPNEREEISRWLAAGYADTFREFHKEGERYSWWSQRMGARSRNVGWRIDYVLASKEAMPFIKDAYIWSDVLGSDHCPVGVTVEEALVLGT